MVIGKQRSGRIGTPGFDRVQDADVFNALSLTLYASCQVSCRCHTGG
jgi:hypothetical protein